MPPLLSFWGISRLGNPPFLSVKEWSEAHPSRSPKDINGGQFTAGISDQGRARENSTQNISSLPAHQAVHALWSQRDHGAETAESLQGISCAEP